MTPACPECGSNRVKTFSTGDAVCENNHNFDAPGAAGSGAMPETLGTYRVVDEIDAPVNFYVDEDDDIWAVLAGEPTIRKCLGATFSKKIYDAMDETQ